jgi:acyl-CoA thioester hydrolase
MTYEEFSLNYPNCYHTDVKWGEMDTMQHVNNTVFFRYFESARMDLFERLMKFVGDRVGKNIGPILASTSCRFKRPLYFPDKVAVGAKVIDVAADRFTLEHSIWSEREQAVAAIGEALIVSFDYRAKKKVTLPEQWTEFLLAQS